MPFFYVFLYSRGWAFRARGLLGAYFFPKILKGLFIPPPGGFPPKYLPLYVDEANVQEQ